MVLAEVRTVRRGAGDAVSEAVPVPTDAGTKTTTVPSGAPTHVVGRTLPPIGRDRHAAAEGNSG
jgi:hypothetical protein